LLEIPTFSAFNSAGFVKMTYKQENNAAQETLSVNNQEKALKIHGYQILDTFFS